MHASGMKSQRRAAPVISARLSAGVRLEAQANGAILACFGGDTVSMGTFGAAVADRTQELAAGLPLSSLTPGSPNFNKEIELLVRRLAGHGLLEYRIGSPGNGTGSLAVIEPQVPGYWPQTPHLSDGDTLVLSRFAYMRRRGTEMVLESPCAGALFRIVDPKLVSFVAALSMPQQIKQLRRQEDFPGLEFLALLADCQIVFKTGIAGESNLRLAEGDHSLALWDFHDLLFHTHSTEGRHTNAMGGTYAHNGVIPPLPAVRPSWPGKAIDLCTVLDPDPGAVPPVAKLLRERHSTRNFDDRQPITLAELSRFLDGAARALPRPESAAGAERRPSEPVPPYPSGGASYALELYLAVNLCEGLAPGLYHYNSHAHALVPIEVPANDVKALLMRAADAMGAPAAPQILITIAARFGRVSWKYSSVAYSLILKDVGVLTQTLYLMASGMGLGGCAIGLANIFQFARMTGVEYQAEGPVGQFAIGRGAISRASD